MRSPTYEHDPPAADRETLDELYNEEGQSLRQIGKRYNVTAATIRNWMKHYGIERRSIHPPVDDVLDVLRAKAPEPTTTREIAGLFDVSLETAHSYLSKIDDENEPVRSKRVGRADVWWYEGDDE